MPRSLVKRGLVSAPGFPNLCGSDCLAGRGLSVEIGTNGKGTTLSRAVYAPTLSTASAAGGPHVSSLNPGNAEQYRYSAGFATNFPITGF